MTTAMRTTATKKVPMDSLRKTALVAGVFYLITFISIPTLALYGPVKNHRDWILSSGSHTGVLVGGFLEVVVALAGIGTAVTLYPVLKRQNEGAALLLGQSLMPAINALLLGTLLYRSRLVPRIIPALGLIGAPLLIGTVIATLFGGLKLGSPMPEALPVAAWELSLGIWLIVKGFKPSPSTTGMATASTPLEERGVAV
jgi:hypothetical protein